MAKTSMINKQQKKPKFSTRAYTRCRLCGRCFFSCPRLCRCLLLRKSLSFFSRFFLFLQFYEIRCMRRLDRFFCILYCFSADPARCLGKVPLEKLLSDV